ncbi:septum formation family protein [Pseudactinotalea sp.]|uniref:septum formation family protein n=1 Tax=Pseudactinotalea sp. TaxID=1926260 RepID=UPI003B3A03DC
MRPHRLNLTRTLLAVAGSAALVAGLAACGDGGEGEETPTGEDTTTSDEVTDDPASDEASDESTDEPADDATSESPSGETGDLDDVPTAEVGACLNLVDLLAGEGIRDIPTVDCTEDHDAQVFALVDLPDGDYPGEDGIKNAVIDECGAAFEAFVGVSPDASELDFDGLPPSEDSWAVGDREVICLAFYPELDTTNESFEGSGV